MTPTESNIEENKQLVTRYIAVLDAHDIDAVVAMTAPDLVNHAATPDAQGVEGLKRILSKLFRAVPDMRWTCEDLIAEVDKVVCRVRVRGTQTGPFEMGTVSLPASGRETSTEQIHVFRIANGKVVEHWAGRDDAGMFRQLGHLPASIGSKVPS